VLKSLSRLLCSRLKQHRFVISCASSSWNPIDLQLPLRLTSPITKQLMHCCQALPYCQNVSTKVNRGVFQFLLVVFQYIFFGNFQKRNIASTWLQAWPRSWLIFVMQIWLTWTRKTCLILLTGESKGQWLPWKTRYISQHGTFARIEKPGTFASIACYSRTVHFHSSRIGLIQAPPPLWVSSGMALRSFKTHAKIWWRRLLNYNVVSLLRNLLFDEYCATGRTTDNSRVTWHVLT